MRISDISAWAICETYALQSPPRTAGRTNVAAFVGTGAHALLAGLTPELVPPIGARLAYDAITPMWQHADIQAIAIARCARDLMAAQGWTPIAHEEEVRRGDELVGHLDIRAWHSEHGEAIIDLKTGQGVGAAWLQVGGYIDLSVERPQRMKWRWCSTRSKSSYQQGREGNIGNPKGGMALFRAWQVNLTRIEEVMIRGKPHLLSRHSLRPLRRGRLSGTRWRTEVK